MNLRHLAVFHAVAETGGVNRAAERLLVSQPAVSRQVRALEDALGVALLERHPRGVRLTHAGEILADYARRLFAIENQAMSVLGDLRYARTGVLRLGGSMSLGDYFLPTIVADFNRDYPGVEVSLEVGNTDSVLNSLRENRLDVGFVEGTFDETQFASELFMHDELIIIAPPDHPLVGRGPIGFAELCRHACIMREPGSGTRAALDRFLERAGVAHTFHLTMGSPEAIKRGVEAGAGLAVASYLTVVDELAAGKLVQVPLAGPPMRRPLHRVTLPHKLLGPAAEPFLALVARRALRYGSPTPDWDDHPSSSSPGSNSGFPGVA